MDLLNTPTLDLERITPLDFSAEHALLNKGISPLAGTDEVGRGCLAGPVVAAAVILDPAAIPQGMRDSKKIKKVDREYLAAEIVRTAHATHVAVVGVEVIDQINILNASLQAMAEAVDGLSVKPAHVLVDGNKSPKWGYPSTLVVKGDDRVLSIAAASILAKVTRDKIMTDLANDFPDYGWEKNAGYGVPHHLAALKLVGVTPHHRKSFKPIREVINQEN